MSVNKNTQRGGYTMKTESKDLEQVMQSSMSNKKLEPAQIPDLELYMDQIITLFEDRLGEDRRRENDKILTKSMVNNYSKERMIRPIRGKKYTREQVLQILLIYNLKNTLSIVDIKQVMCKLMEEGQTAEELESIFKPYSGEDEMVTNLYKLIVDSMRLHYSQELDTPDIVSVLLGMAGLSNYLKRTAETMIDYYFPDN